MTEIATIAAIEAALPWGLHDAYLEAVEIDWAKAKLVLSVRVVVSEHQDMDRHAKITVTGLVFCAIDPPEIDPDRVDHPTPARGLWLDSGEGHGNEDAKSKLPKIPDEAFLHWFFIRPWNRFIHVCGRNAELTWSEDAPVVAREATRALYRGDEIPDPELL